MQNIPNCRISERVTRTQKIGTHTPSPAILTVAVDTLDDKSGNKGVKNIRYVNASSDKGTPLKRSDVGND